MGSHDICIRSGSKVLIARETYERLGRVKSPFKSAALGMFIVFLISIRVLGVAVAVVHMIPIFGSLERSLVRF